MPLWARVAFATACNSEFSCLQPASLKILREYLSLTGQWSVSDKYSLKKLRDKQRGNERKTRTTTTKTKAQGSRKERKGTKNKPKLKANGYKICKSLEIDHSRSLRFWGCRGHQRIPRALWGSNPRSKAPETSERKGGITPDTPPMRAGWPNYVLWPTPHVGAPQGEFLVWEKAAIWKTIISLLHLSHLRGFKRKPHT